ncbi:MAG: AraC family transcriptional regulator [Deltaproteobacteria bacterium]
MGDGHGSSKREGKTVPRALRLVRLGAHELEGDPELARSVRLLVDSLERRAALGVLEQPPATWLVALEVVPLETVPRRAERAVADWAVADRAVQRALTALQLDVRRRWSVQSLAKAVGLSRAAFARRFARALGVSPIAYLAELRLARAAQRLGECDHALAEVAAEVGYESEFAFSRAFKRRYGVPPAAYRRQRSSARPVCLALAA